MAIISRSSTSVANPNLRLDETKRGGGNTKWLADAGDGDGIILIGGVLAYWFLVDDAVEPSEDAVTA